MAPRPSSESSAFQIVSPAVLATPTRLVESDRPLGELAIHQFPYITREVRNFSNYFNTVRRIESLA